MAGRANNPELQDVYFIQCAGEDGPVKIGISSDPLKRLAALQSSNPFNLVLLGIVAGGGRSLEEDLHLTFCEAHLRGEWFEPVTDLMKWIRENANLIGYEHSRPCHAAAIPVGKAYVIWDVSNRCVVDIARTQNEAIRYRSYFDGRLYREMNWLHGKWCPLELRDLVAEW